MECALYVIMMAVIMTSLPVDRVRARSIHPHRDLAADLEEALLAAEKRRLVHNYVSRALDSNRDQDDLLSLIDDLPPRGKGQEFKGRDLLDDPEAARDLDLRDLVTLRHLVGGNSVEDDGKLTANENDNNDDNGQENDDDDEDKVIFPSKRARVGYYGVRPPLSDLCRMLGRSRCH